MVFVCDIYYFMVLFFFVIKNFIMEDYFFYVLVDDELVVGNIDFDFGNFISGFFGRGFDDLLCSVI